MRFKLTLLLLALNAALIVFLFYFEKVQSTRALFDSSSRLILNPDFVQGLDRISITSTSLDQPWVLEHTDNESWLVSSPFQWKANAYAIEQLLFQLRQLSWDSRFSVSDVERSGQSLQTYNLENPPIHLTLQNKGLSITLALGAPTEIGNRLYMMSPDGEFIQVVNRSLLDVLHRDLEAFLDRRVFGMSEQGIRAIQIQDRSTSSLRVRLERTEGRWEFVSPITTMADRDKVDAMIQGWQNLEVKAFETGESAGLGMAGETLRLTFEGMGERETLIIAPSREGENGNRHMARREAFPATFRIETDLVAELKSVQEKLREKRILGTYSDSWTSLEISFGELSVTLQELENGAWQVLSTNGSGELLSLPASQEAVAGMRALLRDMEAERFITDAPSEADLDRFGLAEPQRRLVLRSPSGPLVELLIGGVYRESEETLLYARSNLANSVFLVRPHVLASLRLDPLHYREKTIRSLPANFKLEEISLIRRKTGESLLDRPIEESEVGMGNLEEILGNYLQETRFEKFLNRKFSDPLYLDESRQIEWPYLLEAKTQSTGNNSGGEPQRLFLSERLGGNTQYVGDPASGLVGTLPPRLIEALDPVLATYPEAPEPPAEIKAEDPTPLPAIPPEEASSAEDEPLPVPEEGTDPVS